MMRPMIRVVLLACLAACGPVAYVQQVTFNADNKVEEARVAKGDKWSLYWWARATQYLHMARERAGHADFQAATKFGRLAAEAAAEAKREGELGEQDPSKLPYIKLDKKGVAPAKDAKDKDAVAPAKDAVAPAKEDDK